MTRLEAIKRLEWLATETTGDLAGEQGDYAEFLARVIDALDMAIAALREQESNADQRVSNTANALTNADHIRSMTDEELGDFLGGIFSRGWIYGAAGRVDDDPDYHEWLKQPYKEET